MEIPPRRVRKFGPSEPLVCVCGLAELEAFEKRQKGKRKKNRRNTEVEVEEGAWLKYRKYLLVPVCGILLAVGAFYLLQVN
ncbi:hypothetical protein NFI96_003903 [Prochilodus magdalenae]|nr:hypothetical protein NFI96_003903 [Prochilodus magdalenae]